MRKWLLSLSLLICGVALVATDADARRLGGGRSVGAQRSVTAPPASTPAKPAQQQGAPQTDVVALNADLLELATEQNQYWASVRFSGTVRETPGTQPVGFEEVWNLVKPADGSSGWLLAGIQQMH